MAAGSNLLRIRSQFDDRVTGKIGKLRDNFDRLGKSKGAMTVLQGVGMGAGISAWGLVDRAIGTVVDTLGNSIQAASDQREAMALNAQVFEHNADAMEKWAESSNDAFSKSEAINYAAQFGNALKNVGFELAEVTTKSQTLATLAGDLGSAFNASSEEAATALRSGLLGESEPLRRFGVFLDETKVKAKAAAMGMEPLNGKLTDGQKVAARYALIMEQTADSQGMFGRDTESLADAQKSLQSNIEDVEAALAEKLIPRLAEFTNSLADVAAEATKDGGTVDVLGDAWSDLMNTFDPQPTYEAKTALGGLDRALTDVISNALDFITAWDEYVPASEERRRAAEAETQALREQEAALIDFRAAERASLEPGWELRDVAKATTRQFRHLTGATNQTIDQLKDLEKTSEDALDALLESVLGPKELRNELSLATMELADNEKKLNKLRDIEDPTREQRRDIKETKAAVYDSKEEVTRLTARLEAMGQIPRGTTHTTIETLFGRLAASTDQAKELYYWLGLVNGTSGRSGPTKGGKSNRNSRNEMWASGGYAAPGSAGTVGEEGPERLVMFPGGGGWVIPNAGGGRDRGGDATVIHTHINVDGREMARVVDKHLYYTAAGAPR